jgi:hypothetical protein
MGSKAAKKKGAATSPVGYNVYPAVNNSADIAYKRPGGAGVSRVYYWYRRPFCS